MQIRINDSEEDNIKNQSEMPANNGDMRNTIERLKRFENIPINKRLVAIPPQNKESPNDAL